MSRGIWKARSRGCTDKFAGPFVTSAAQARDGGSAPQEENMKHETGNNVLTEKEMKRIAVEIVSNYFHKDDFSPSHLREIRRAIVDGIKEAIAIQNGA